MSSLLGRLFGRPSRTLPSYSSSYKSPDRTPIGKIIFFATLVGSGYCATSLFGHFFLNYGYTAGNSMSPTLPESSGVSINSPRYRHGKGVKLGDIVHAKSPILPHSMIGKKIIGMPGDYVLKDENLAPTAGGARMPGIYEKERGEPVMVQVPEGHVWLAGDNLSRSRDSRFYGPVPLAMIESKLLYNGDGWFSWQSFRQEQLKPVGKLDAADLEVKESNTSGKID